MFGSVDLNFPNKFLKSPIQKSFFEFYGLVKDCVFILISFEEVSLAAFSLQFVQKASSRYWPSRSQVKVSVNRHLVGFCVKVSTTVAMSLVV